MPPPLPLGKLPEVDVVLISHNHYDHLDVDTIKSLGNKPLYFVPLGLKTFFEDLGISNVVELDWWQEKKFSFRGVEMTATCTPAQHFSSRTTFDRNKVSAMGENLEELGSPCTLSSGAFGMCSFIKSFLSCVIVGLWFATLFLFDSLRLRFPTRLRLEEKVICVSTT